MKKLVLVLVSLAIAAVAQSNFNGYDKVSWGSSLAVVKQNYPGLIEMEQVLTNSKAAGIKSFLQYSTGKGIVSRNFYFFENKLYSVMVDYDESVNFQDLREKLESIYGIPYIIDGYGDVSESVSWEHGETHISSQAIGDFVFVAYHHTPSYEKVMDKIKKAKQDALGL